MFWIEWRDHGTRTRFETDEHPNAVSVLANTILDPASELIDYSYTLDGSIDNLLRRLDSVQIGYYVDGKAA